jgi:type VI secretion system secreted protein VgrG
MATYSQDNRPFRIDTPLGKDEVLLAGFTAVERISAPFEITADLLAVDEAITLKDLLRKPVTIYLKLASGKERPIHGIVREFSQLGRRELLTAYRMVIVPSIWFMKLTRESKIYQRKNVVDIVKDVFKDFDVKVEVQCVKTYPNREYCVQYRESHFDFVSRLLEDEGIHYYFKHGKNSHTLVLDDDSTNAVACPGGAPAAMAATDAPWQEKDVVVELTSELAAHTGKITLWDTTFVMPHKHLEAEAAAQNNQLGEWYDYPGGQAREATTAPDSDTSRAQAAFNENKRYVRLHSEEKTAFYKAVRGDSNCRFLVTGHKFELEGHYRSDVNGPYHVVEVQHTAKAGHYRTWDDGAALDYRNKFVALPMATKYRPPRSTPRPIVHGTQTAVVVGPAGEEIYTDKYGRIRAQFHWDRDGKNDPDSSCWMRVATTWAGKQWGAISIPRIGQEVVVAFLEGNPDSPLVVGSVYNADMMPPYELPANMTQSGVKSRSSLKGESDNFNEIRFEDKKGDELVYIHAEKDKQVEVENDRNEHVGHDETYTIDHDQTVHVGHDRTETVDNDESITIGGNRTESVAKDESISIDGARTESVGKDETITITKNRTESVGKDENVDIGQHRTVTIAKNETLNIGETRATEVGKDDTLKVGKKYILEAGDEITIKTGDASISMKKDGTIKIKGKDITIDGSGKINVKAASDVVMKGSKVLSN